MIVHDTITDSSGTKLDGDDDSRAGGNWERDFVVISTAAPPVTLSSASGLPFDIAVGAFGAGELIQGYRKRLRR